MRNAKRWLMGVLLAVTVPGTAVAGENQRVQKLDDALNDVVIQLLKGAPSLKRGMTVAIADFGDFQGQFTAFGRHVAEEVLTRIARSGSVRAIERAQLPTMLAELRFNQGDLFDPNFVKRLGRFLGADMTLTGTITDFGSAVRINARLFNTERGLIEAGAAVTVAKDNEVANLLGVRLDPVPLVRERPRDEPDQAKTGLDSPQHEPDQLVFQNHLIRVTVKSLTRTNGRLTLGVWYENLTEHNLTLGSAQWGRAYATDHRGTYLIGDNGEKWEFQDDTQVGNRYGGTELIPQQRLLNQIVFAPEGGGTDTRVTYAGSYRIRWRQNRSESFREEEFQVVIRNIELEGASSADGHDATRPAVDSGDRRRGESIYQIRCAVCHGRSGDGRGQAAAALDPGPSDLRRSTIGRERVSGIITHGIPKTSMVPWKGVLSEDDLRDVAEYVMSLRR